MAGRKTDTAARSPKPRAKVKRQRKNPKWDLLDPAIAVERWGDECKKKRADVEKLGEQVDALHAAIRQYTAELVGRKYDDVQHRARHHALHTLERAATMLIQHFDGNRKFFTGGGLPTWWVEELRPGNRSSLLQVALEHIAVAIIELLRSLSWETLAQRIDTKWAPDGHTVLEHDPRIADDPERLITLDHSMPYGEFLAWGSTRYIIIDRDRFTYPTVSPDVTHHLRRAAKKLDDLLTKESLWLTKRPPMCVVELFGVDKNPKVFGEEVEKLPRAKYPVIEALVGAGERGMSKSELEKVNGEAIKYLRQIRKSNPLWEEAIEMAGIAWNRYKLKFTAPSPPRKRNTIVVPAFKTPATATK